MIEGMPSLTEDEARVLLPMREAILHDMAGAVGAGASPLLVIASVLSTACIGADSLIGLNRGWEFREKIYACLQFVDEHSPRTEAELRANVESAMRADLQGAGHA